MKKIKFIPQYNDFRSAGLVDLPTPVTASKVLPEWYSKSERFLGGADKPQIKNLSTNSGLKTCMPFLDALTSGYMLTTWTDIQVTSTGPDTCELTWLVEPNPIAERPRELGQNIPRPAGHCSTHFAWQGQWGVEVPKGFSLLYTHPLNRYDLPFTTLSGVVDSDVMPSGGNFPVFFKTGWEGIIPAGTPFAQMIPIKRESWASEIGDEADTRKLNQLSYNSRAVSSGLYRKTQWFKKEYK